MLSFRIAIKILEGFAGGSVVKNLPANAGDASLIPGSGRSLGQEDPLEKEMATRSRILPGESHGQRSLAGYNAKGHKELDETEHACTQAVIDFLP